MSIDTDFVTFCMYPGLSIWQLLAFGAEELFGWFCPVHGQKVFLFLLMFTYFERERERERERVGQWGEGTQRGRERITSRLHAVRAEPDAGLHLMNFGIMTWAKIKSWTLNRLSPPGAPCREFNSVLLLCLLDAGRFPHPGHCRTIPGEAKSPWTETS